MARKQEPPTIEDAGLLTSEETAKLLGLSSQNLKHLLIAQMPLAVDGLAPGLPTFVGHQGGRPDRLTDRMAVVEADKVHAVVQELVGRRRSIDRHVGVIVVSDRVLRYSL